MTLKAGVMITIGIIVATPLTSGIAAAFPNVYASALGPSDFPKHPERFCAGWSYHELCVGLNICHDEGERLSWILSPNIKFGRTFNFVSFKCPFIKRSASMNTYISSTLAIHTVSPARSTA